MSSTRQKDSLFRPHEAAPPFCNHVAGSPAIDFTNALTWVFVFDPSGPISQVATAPLIFGYRAQDLAANPGLTPGLSSGMMKVGN